MSSTSEATFESVIESHLLANGYDTVGREGFDAERAIFPDTVLAFIRAGWDTSLIPAPRDGGVAASF